MNKKKNYTVSELIEKLNEYPSDATVHLDFKLECLVLKKDYKTILDKIELGDWVYDKYCFMSDEKIYGQQPSLISDRFRYVSVAEHGRRRPAYILDYLTMRDYTDVKELEPLLNHLWNKQRFDDMLRNELITINSDKYQFGKERKQHLKRTAHG